MRRSVATVLSKAEIAPSIHLFLLQAPEVAASAEAGQFVQVRCGRSSDPLLRRPISIHRTSRLSRDLPGNDNIALLVREMGPGTQAIAATPAGASLDLLGPLGQGFTLKPKTRHLLLVAGGIGIAPLVAAADAAIRRDIAVTLLAGATTAVGLLAPQWLPMEIEVVAATDDGSLGHHGMVTDLLPSYLSWADQIFVCGPSQMLPPIKRQIGDHTVPVQVSLEERMACGVGACLSCVVETRHGLQRVCRDGPVFDLEELRW